MIYFSLFLAVLILTFQILREKIKKDVFKPLFFIALYVYFCFSGFLISGQYFIWRNNGLSKFLLPPYRDISYFANYALSRFLGNGLIALLAALGFIWIARRLNQKSKGKFFYPEEIWIGGTAIFLSGNPGWLLYLLILFGVYLLAHVFSRLFRGKDLRLSFYYLWIPVFILVIIIMVVFQQSLPWWNQMKI